MNKIVPIIPLEMLSFSQKWVSFQPGISLANYTDPILTYFLNKLAHSLWGQSRNKMLFVCPPPN